MSTTFTTISVPQSLGLLIRAIASAEHKAVTELLSGWAKEAATKLGWDQDFSPIHGTIDWDGTEFIIRATFFGESHRDFTIAQARSLAGSLMDLAERGGAPRAVDAAQANLDAAGRFGFVVVTRKGSGIILAINDYRCSMSTGVAQGVARKLQELALAAEAKSDERAEADTSMAPANEGVSQPASPNSSRRPRKSPRVAKDI